MQSLQLVGRLRRERLVRDPLDGAVKKAWAFVMTLSWSRHQYVEFAFDQEVATWLRCHRHAFEKLPALAWPEE